jgi:hypothetical protein
VWTGCFQDELYFLEQFVGAIVAIVVLRYLEQTAFLVTEFSFHVQHDAVTARAGMRAVVVVALQCHELHIEIAVVIVLRLSLAQQPLIGRPDEKLTEYPLVAWLRVALGGAQQIVIVAIEVCGTPGRQ